MRIVKISLIVLAFAGAGCVDSTSLQQILRDLASSSLGDDQTVADVADQQPSPDSIDGSGQPTPSAGIMQARVRNESARSADVTIRFLLNNIVVHLAELRIRPLSTTAITGPDLAQLVEFTAVDEIGAPLPTASFVFEAGADNLVVYVILECLADIECDDGTFCNGAERCVEGSCQAGEIPCPVDRCNEVADECIDCIAEDDCDDGLFCTGVEQCVDGRCQAGAEPCPGLSCDEAGGRCVECLDDAQCTDGQFCNGAETCTGGACQAGSDPCPDQECDETADQCIQPPQITDCNDNGIDDDDDIRRGISSDCNQNGRPDECEDCNGNGIPDACDVACESEACLLCFDGDLAGCAGVYAGGYFEFSIEQEGTVVGTLGAEGTLSVTFVSPSGQVLFDAAGTVGTNGAVSAISVSQVEVVGEFDFETCSAAGDWGDISFGSAAGTWFVDRVCAEDCNSNLVPDECDLESGVSEDRNGNGVPDECEDCNGNGVMDTLDIENLTSADCNGNWVPDECDIADATSTDSNENGVPDECEDCNTNGQPDDLDISFGFSGDCNTNGLPDECDIAAGTSLDVDLNGLPDECIALYVVERFNPQLSIVDPETGELTVVANMFPEVSGAFGLAHAPDGQMYAVIDATNVSVLLVTVNLASGEVTPIGPLSEPIADIAFDDNGVLYGVLGGYAEGLPSGEVVTIDTTDAAVSTNGLLGSEGAGQSIAHRPATDLLFHSFCPEGCGLETVDVLTGAVADIAVLTNRYQALTYDIQDGRLLGFSWSPGDEQSNLYEIDPDSGLESLIPEVVGAPRITGMAFGPGPFPSPQGP